MSITIFVGIISHNSPSVGETLASLVEEPYHCDIKFIFYLLDNNSSSRPEIPVSLANHPQFSARYLDANVGFATGANLIIAEGMRRKCDYALLLNPDVICSAARLAEFFQKLHEFKNVRKALARRDKIALATCVLMRDEFVADSTGMIFTREIRHFDENQGVSIDVANYREIREIKGATGAFLALDLKLIEQLKLSCERDDILLRVYPQLGPYLKERYPLFDDAFFAYREDADLAWRAHILGLKTVLIPVTAQHSRTLRENESRASQSPFVRSLGVKNRFLLILNNFHLVTDRRAILRGLIYRNLLVILGVVLWEVRSIGAFWDVFKLLPRALHLRRQGQKGRKGTGSVLE